ncbi:MAG: twin transmembrane helix small protein [Parvularculales bacterium]
MTFLYDAAIPIALLVVLGVLLAGLWNMMRSGSSSRSQNLMRLRVIMQFVAVVLIMAGLYFLNE